MLDINSVCTWIWLLLLLGFIIGILSGFFGVGGCFILTPLLNILGLPMAFAVGTGLFFAVIVSLLGGIKHYLAGNALVKISIIMGLFSFFGIQFSQPLVLYLDRVNLADFYIRLLYIVLLFTLGFLTLKKKTVYSSKISQDKVGFNSIGLITKFRSLPPRISVGSDSLPLSIWPIIVIALLVGLLQGFLGVGGGFILVPVLIVFLNIKPHLAIGTSLVTIVLSSIYASFLYFLAGKVLLLISLCLGLGSILGVNFGVKATSNINEDKLKKLYSFFLIFTSFGIILKSFNYNLLSICYMLTLSFGMGIFILFVYYFKKGRSSLSE